MSDFLRLENDSILLSLQENCAGFVTDKNTGAEWRFRPSCYQERGPIAEEVVWNRRERCWADIYMSRFKAEKLDGKLRVKVLDPIGNCRGSFTACFELDGPFLRVSVSDIDEQLESLMFPAPLVSESLVLPQVVGRWIREDDGGMESEFSAQNNGLNMRWFGGLKGDEKSGWMAITEKGYGDSAAYRNGLNMYPIWLKSKYRWPDTPRSVLYRFTSDGWVGMARAFRGFARENGFFRTIEEKMEDTPALKKLLGGRIVSAMQCWTPHASSSELFMKKPSPKDLENDGKPNINVSHGDMKKAMELAREWGMKKGVFNLRGTWTGGYDESHPDIWPPEPGLGSIEELRELVDFDENCVTLMHDNYQDIYPRTESFPEGVVRKSDGTLLHGGFWHGGLCYIICPEKQLEYAKRNWEKIRTLNPKGHFIDTATCVQFYQCWHPEHPMTRDGDWQAKIELIKFFKDQGLLLGSEEAADFGMGYLDFLENRHIHVPGESIPVWPLVFHDAAFYARYPSDGTSGGEAASQLENMLWGYMSYWPVNNLADWKTREKEFRESLAVDEFHEKVGLAQMTNHRYHCSDRMVEQTEFSTGYSVLANFANEERKVEGVSVPAGGHVILNS